MGQALPPSLTCETSPLSLYTNDNETQTKGQLGDANPK